MKKAKKKGRVLGMQSTRGGRFGPCRPPPRLHKPQVYTDIKIFTSSTLRVCQSTEQQPGSTSTTANSSFNFSKGNLTCSLGYEPLSLHYEGFSVTLELVNAQGLGKRREERWVLESNARDSCEGKS